MKAALFLIAVLGLANASVLIPERQKAHSHHVRSRDLNDLFQQFVAFIPFDKCKAIVDDYLANNADVQAAYAFLLSDEFKSLTDKVVAMPEYQNFLKYLSDCGVDIYAYQNIIREMLGLPTIEPPTVGQPKMHRIAVRESGIILMITDILNALPIAEIKQWFYETCLPDPAFQDLLSKLTSQEFRDLVDNIYHTQEYQELTDVLRSQGIDVAAIEKVIADFISGHFMKTVEAEPTLKELADQFLAFIPTDKILNIVISYIDDPDIQEVLAYLQGKEFYDMVVLLEGVQELNDFLAWVYSHNIDVYKYINEVLSFLDIPPFVPPRIPLFRNPSVQSFLDMIAEIEAVIPVADIVAWYHSTCENAPEFLDLLAQLRSDSFQVVVDTVVKDPAFTTAHNLLLKFGVPIEEYEAWMKNFFGW